MDGIRKRPRLWMWLAAIALFVCLLPAGRAVETPPVVRVGVFELNGFYEPNRDGLPEGYGADYWDKIAEITGWTYEYVWAENWDACLDLLRQGKVDFIAPTQKTEERLREFVFSAFSIGEECGALLALDTNDSLIYEDFQAFDRLTIGCVDSLVFRKDFVQYGAAHGFTPSFASYRDTHALLAALREGEVQAVLVNLFAKTEDTKVLAKFGVAPFYIMANQNQAALLPQLNQALQEIRIESVGFDNDLMETYYPCFHDAPFTKAELEWIGSAPPLRVACRSDIQPVSFCRRSTGEVAGMNRVVLEEVSRISGLTFSYVPLPAGEITYAYFLENNIDLISAVENNQENMAASGITLTVPYLDTKKVFVCSKDAHFDADTEMVLAVSTGSQTLVAAIHDKYPKFAVRNYPTLGDCFEAVRKNEAGALLQNQYVVSAYLAKPRYADMTIIPVEGLRDQLCLSPVLHQDTGANKDFLSDARLISVLNKSIRRISDEERAKIIIQQTAENQYHYTLPDFLYQYRYPIALLALIGTALLFTGLHLRYLKGKSTRMIAENEAKLRNITNNINGGVVVLVAGDKLRISYANDGFLNLLQCDRVDYDQIKDQKYTTYVHPDDIAPLKSLVEEGDNQISMKLRIMRRDGRFVPTLFNGTLTVNARGEQEIYCVIMDISEQERLIERIFLEQKKYALLIENSGDIIFEADCQKKELTLSPLFEEKFGWPVRKAAFSNMLPDVLAVLSVREVDKGALEAAMTKTLTQRVKTEAQVRMRKADGTDLWCRVVLYPMADAQGELAVVIGQILDVDEEVRSRAELEKKSRLDALTGLLNKEAFFTEAGQYLASAAGANAALAFLDVDNFKEINDRLGHMAGDSAIKETAKSLQVIFSHYDLLARFGGDEFCVLLKEIPLGTLEDKLAWTVKKLRCTHRANGEEVHTTISIGAACTGGDNTPLRVLLERADKALYCAKESGKDQYIIAEEPGAPLLPAGDLSGK